GGDAGLGLMGPLDAAAGVANPPIATPMQQSLAALALVRLSETAQMSGPVRERARTLARSVMADLAVLEPVEVEVQRDGVAAAVAWVVLDELGTGADEPLAGLAARCEEMLGAHAAAERDAPVAGVSEAVLVWALAERAA